MRDDAAVTLLATCCCWSYCYFSSILNPYCALQSYWWRTFTRENMQILTNLPRRDAWNPPFNKMWKNSAPHPSKIPSHWDWTSLAVKSHSRPLLIKTSKYQNSSTSPHQPASVYLYISMLVVTIHRIWTVHLPNADWKRVVLTQGFAPATSPPHSLRDATSARSRKIKRDARTLHCIGNGNELCRRHRHHQENDATIPYSQ